jgi:hypothetical protein
LFVIYFETFRGGFKNEFKDRSVII